METTSNEASRAVSPARLALLFALQFAIPGAYLPGLWPYLRAKGLSADEVGVAFALAGVGAVAAPFYAGQIADRWLRADRLLGFCYLLLGGGCAWLATQDSALGVQLALLGMGLVWAPTIGLTQSVSLAHIGDRDRLGPVRAFGTVGWIVSGIASAQWLRFVHTPADLSGEAMRQVQDLGRGDGLWMAAGLSILAGVMSLTLLPATPPSREGRAFAPGEAASYFRKQPLLTLMLATLMLACVDRFLLMHGAQFLTQVGGGEPEWLKQIFGEGGAGLLSMGQITEVGMLFAFPFLAARLSARQMLLSAGVLFTVRMAIFTWSDSFALVMLATAAHGICFTLFFFAGFLVVDRVCPKSVRTSGQALYQLCFGGFGGTVGSLVAARASEWPMPIFTVPFWLALTATLLLWTRYPAADTGKLPIQRVEAG